MSTILAYAADEKVRRMASSGGLCKALLAHMLESEQVDGVVIARTGIEGRFAPGFFVTDDPQEVLQPNTNSVYYPVSPRQTIIDLPIDKRYAATLLPCEAAWLKRIQNAGKLKQVVFVIGLMCNAVPNRQWTDRLLDKLGTTADDARDFAYRSGGWPGEAAAAHDGKREAMSFCSAWGNLGTQESLCAKCKCCRFDGTLGMDLMVSDPWTSDPRTIGVGKTMAHLVTDAGKEAVADAEMDGAIVVEPIKDWFFHKQLADVNNVKRKRRLGKPSPFGSTAPRSEKRLRVGLITPALYWGGAERWMLDLARQSQHAIDWTGVACVTKQFRDQTMAGLFDPIMPVVEYGAEAVQEVAARADALVAWGAYDLAAMVDGFRGPVVFVGHGSGSFDREAVRQCFSGATHFTCVAEASLEPFDGFLPRDKVQVIHNGIDPQRCVQTTSREKVREQLGVTDDEFLVGFVGRLVPEKNPVGLAKAIAMLPERFRAVFVGGGWDLNRQRADIHELLGQRAIFVDRTEQVGNYYRAMDTFALLSPREGFSMGMLEAMYCGTPCVLTNVGVLPELERLVGRHWETVPTGNKCAWMAAKAIARIAALPKSKRAALVGDCKRIVDEQFLASHMAQRWIDYLNRIVSEWHAKKTEGVCA